MSLQCTQKPSYLKMPHNWSQCGCLCGRCPGFSIASLTSSLAVGQQSPQLDLESRRSLFLSAFNSNFVPFFVYLLSALPFSWFCLRKIQSHKLMLDQMSHFNLGHANCSLDSDRKLIEEQVLQLFDEALAPPVQVCFCAGAHEDYDDHEVLVSPEDIQEIRHITSYPSGIEVLDQFNAYVRGPLSDIVLRSVGKEQSISCKLCFVVSFPLWLLGLVFVLGCDGRSECETSAMYAGYGTVSEYMASNAAINLLFQPLVNVLGLPLMLWANHLTTTCFSAYSLQILIGSVLSGLVLKLMDNLFFAQRGMLIVVVTRFSTTAGGSHSQCDTGVGALLAALLEILAPSTCPRSCLCDVDCGGKRMGEKHETKGYDFVARLYQTVSSSVKWLAERTT